MSMIVLTWYRNSLEMKRSYWILIFSLVSDDGDDYDEKDDDIYFMTECLSVCLCVTKNHHFLYRSVCQP